MKKKVFLLVSLIVVALLAIVLLEKTNEKDLLVTDSVKFKEEYESLNGKINESNGKEYRSISISEDNPFVYKEASDIVDMINNKETFAVYFGFNSCPWCRSVIPTLIEVARDLNIEKIYYLDVKNIRDTMRVNDNGEIERTKEGTDDYYKLIKLLSNVLNDYSLNDFDGNLVSTGEKRIYAPNVVVIMNGEAYRLESGISDKQTDGYIELTDEMKSDTYYKFKCLLECMKENKNSCNASC